MWKTAKGGLDPLVAMEIGKALREMGWTSARRGLRTGCGRCAGPRPGRFPRGSERLMTKSATRATHASLRARRGVHTSSGQKNLVLEVYGKKVWQGWQRL